MQAAARRTACRRIDQQALAANASSGGRLQHFRAWPTYLNYWYYTYPEAPPPETDRADERRQICQQQRLDLRQLLASDNPVAASITIS